MQDPISKQQKKEKNLILILVIIVVITAVILWQGVFKKEQSEFSGISAPAGGFGIVKIININYDVLGSSFIKELNPIEPIAPFEGEIGRKNPFLSY